MWKSIKEAIVTLRNETSTNKATIKHKEGTSTNNANIELGDKISSSTSMDREAATVRPSDMDMAKQPHPSNLEMAKH